MAQVLTVSSDDAAGDGDDVVRAADGSADSVDCGGGTDIAVADPTDVLAACETVTMPVPPDATKPVPTVKAGKLKGSAVKVPVLCPATELRCVGSVNLKAAGKADGKKVIDRRSASCWSSRTAAGRSRSW